MGGTKKGAAVENGGPRMRERHVCLLSPPDLTAHWPATAVGGLGKTASAYLASFVTLYDVAHGVTRV